MLRLETFKPGAGGLDCPLLLLVGADIALNLLQFLNLFAQAGELRLGFGERAGKAAVHPGIEGK